MENTARALTDAIPVIGNFELKRYAGRWYEIARLPHFFERGLTHVSADYEPMGNGLVKVTNSGIRKNGRRTEIQGTARFAGKPDAGDLEVSFFPPFWSPYRIIFLDSDYTEAVVTGKTMEYLWVLSRTTNMSAFKLNRHFSRLESLGFDLLQIEFP